VGERVARIRVDRAQRRLAGRAVVRVAGADALPVDLRGLHKQPLRLHLPDDAGDVPSQVEADADLAVPVAQEDDVLDADLLGGRTLLVPPDATDLIAGNRGVEATRVTVGHDAVRHGDALGGPGRDRARRTEVHVVGVRHDHQGPVGLLLIHVGILHQGRHVRPGDVVPDEGGSHAQARPERAVRARSRTS